MNQAIRNIFLEYLTSGDNVTHRRNAVSSERPRTSRTTNAQNIFHERQMESRQMDMISDMIYYYNRNFADYQQNMTQLTGLLEEIQRARNPFYYLQTADISLNNLFRNNAQSPLESTVPITQTFAQGPDLNGWDTILRWYTTPQITRTPTSETQRFRSYLTNSDIERATCPLTFSLSGEPFFDIRCPITLEDFREGDELYQINGCGHVFKSSSLRGWFGRNTSCPVCRYNVMEYLYDLSRNERIHLERTAVTEAAATEPTIRRRVDTSNNTNPFDAFGELNEYAQLFNTEMNNNEGIRQIADIFNDFMTNPAPNRSYSIDSSNNRTSYRFDFTLY